MLTCRVIPCLDVANGRVVKGVRFQNLRDAGCPWELAARYASEGADEIVLLDVAATPANRRAGIDAIRRVREVISIPLTVGGGVRGLSDVARLLDAGADKVAMNSAAVADSSLVARVAERFGCQCTVVAIDASASVEGQWKVRTHSGVTTSGLNAVDWAVEAASLGAGEILLTSWDRDGTQSGFDLQLLMAVTRRLRVPVIASGGAATAQDFVEAYGAGASALLAASIFHDGIFTINEIKRRMASAGLEVRN